MRCKIDRQVFHKAIAVVETIIPAREIRSVISNILIEAKDNRISLTATDLDLAIRTSIAAEIETEGIIAIPAKKLSQSVREFRGSIIDISVAEDKKIQIIDGSGNSNTKIQLMGNPADEFPALPVSADAKFTSLPAAVISEMIRKTIYSIAEEEPRYIFKGLYLEGNSDKTTMVGTDGRRLARIHRDFGQTPFSDGVILPAKGVKELIKHLDSEDIELALDQKERRIHFRTGSVDLICKLIDGQFPDYRQVIPKKVDYRVEINRQGLESALRQVSIMAAEPSRQVIFHFTPGTLTISAQTPDVGDAEDSIEVDYQGEEIKVAFNSYYILDVLRVLDTEIVVLGFSSPAAPAIIEDQKDPDFVSVVMPMKL